MQTEFAATGSSRAWMESRAAMSAAAARHSFVRRELEAAAGGGGSAVVPPGAEFDAAVDDPEIEAMDEAAVAALLAKIPQARPRPLAILDDVIGDALGHGACRSHLRDQPVREAGEETHQTRHRDDGPAHALRLQQDGVHLVDLGRHAVELLLHVGDLLLQHGEALARGTRGTHGRLQMVLAIFSSERPPT